MWDPGRLNAGTALNCDETHSDMDRDLCNTSEFLSGRPITAACEEAKGVPGRPVDQYEDEVPTGYTNPCHAMMSKDNNDTQFEVRRTAFEPQHELPWNCDQHAAGAMDDNIAISSGRFSCSVDRLVQVILFQTVSIETL